MHTVNLIPRSTPTTLTFVFKHHKNADEVYKRAMNAIKEDTIIEIEDDFGTMGVVRMADIAAISFSEYEKDMQRNGELGLIQHKEQLKTQKKAQSDLGLQILGNDNNSARQ